MNATGNNGEAVWVSEEQFALLGLTFVVVPQTSTLTFALPATQHAVWNADTRVGRSVQGYRHVRCVVGTQRNFVTVEERNKRTNITQAQW